MRQDAIPIAAWIDPGQADLARAVADAAGLTLAAAGGPGAGRSAPAAEALGAPHTLPDLRSTLAEAGAGLDVRAVLILSREALAGPDIPALLAAHARRVVVAHLEPSPSRLDDLIEGGWLGRPDAIRPLDALRPLARLRASSTMRHARDMLTSFGPIRSAWIRGESRAAAGSLGARLIDALDLLHELLGQADGLHAATSELDPSRPTEDLSALSGEACVTLSYAAGPVASITATDRAGHWTREATLLGPEGLVRLSDGAFTWHAPDGALRDEWREPKAAAAARARFPAAAALAESITRLLDPHAPTEPPLDSEAILAAAHAAILSTRTRGTESPATFRRMMASE